MKEKIAHVQFIHVILLTWILKDKSSCHNFLDFQGFSIKKYMLPQIHDTLLPRAGFDFEFEFFKIILGLHGKSDSS